MNLISLRGVQLQERCTTPRNVHLTTLVLETEEVSTPEESGLQVVIGLERSMHGVQQIKRFSSKLCIHR